MHEAGGLSGKDLADLGVRVCGLWCCLKLTARTLWFSAAPGLLRPILALW